MWSMSSVVLQLFGVVALVGVGVVVIGTVGVARHMAHYSPSLMRRYL
jgi:hypothetical protein